VRGGGRSRLKIKTVFQLAAAQASSGHEKHFGLGNFIFIAHAGLR
jgi:hypothetical protein